MVRDVVLPTARSFGLSGTARIADNATDAVIDQVLGLPTAAEGGVDVTSSRHLPGDLTARATSAVDGDPTTHWMPGFLGQDGEWAAYEVAEPITFDRMDLAVVADGRHSVPTRLRLVVDGRDAAVLDVPPIADRPERDAVVEVPLTLPDPVTGRRIEVRIEASRPVVTNDWISTAPITMPVGITEWGIPGLVQPPPDAVLDSGCRTDLVEVDGEPVAVRVSGDADAALGGDALDVATCDGDALDLPEGTSTLRTGAGRDLGIHVDTLTLRSAAGGVADDATGLLVTPGPQPTAEVVEWARWRQSVEVGPRSEPTWLVIGQSHNAGWRASVDGRDLGEPVLLDGYSSGFLLPPGDDALRVDVEWRPQRVVFGGLALSSLAALGAVVLALRPWRWRRRAAGVSPGDPALVPGLLDERPLGLSRPAVLVSPGATPGWLASALLAVGAGAVATVAVNPVAGAVLAAAALGAARVPRLRPLVTVLPAALLALAGAYVLLQQVRHGLPAGFDWPTRFGRVHGVAYTGVLLLGLGVVVDRLRTGRWDPSRQADSS